MAFEHYIYSDGKKYRMGYTTGTCAALASCASLYRLLKGEWPEAVSLMTPKGIQVEVCPEECSCTAGTAVCGVYKDGGDDVDATHGALIMSRVTLNSSGIINIDGGEGVGRVTKPGLDQPVGNAAINSVPRRMIQEEAEKLLAECGTGQGADIVISVPDGQQIAKRTFNPNLGIEGGISIIGTSGIVEPMSLQALSDTMKIELRQVKALGSRRVVLAPGNYGLDFISADLPQLKTVPIVKISNFIGDALDECAVLGFEEILIIGHIGKMIKVAGGIMNTHSRYADCRTELFCAHAAAEGASQAVCRELLDCASTDACLEILEKNGLRGAVMERITAACGKHIVRRAGEGCLSGMILFSNVYGLLGITGEGRKILSRWEVLSADKEK